jgi:hypothetical protein
MTKRLLTELFPHFVKKSQIQYLSPGPFGWGLDAAELEKARVYLKPGQQAPEGANVQTGPQGGKYYDEGGGGAAAGPDAQGDQPTYESVPEDMADRQQVAVDEMQQINQQRMAEYQDAQAAGPEALAEWEAGDAQRKEGEAAARADIEGLRDARAQGPEAEAAYNEKREQEESAKYQEMVAQVEAELPNKLIEDGPFKGKTFGEVDQELKEFGAKVDADYAKETEKMDKLLEMFSGQTTEERQKGLDDIMAEIETLRAQNEAEAAGQTSPQEGSGGFTPASDDPSSQRMGGSDFGQGVQPEGGVSEQTSPPAQDMLSEISEKFNQSLPTGLNQRIEALLDNPQLTNEQSVDMLSEISEKFNVSLPSGLNRRIEALLDTEAAGQTSPPDVSEPTFDGQGNIQTPGSDPYPISELTGSDKETVNALGEQYQQGGGSNPSELLSGYDGPLTEDGVSQYLSDKVQYDDAFISDNDYNNAIDFAGWVGGQAGTETPTTSSTSGPNSQTLDSPDGLNWEGSGFSQDDFEDAVIETQGSGHDLDMVYSGAQTWMEENEIDPNSPLGGKLFDHADSYARDRVQGAAEYYGEDYALMAKMMQKYNVDNKRPDPVILSNKGGRQR